MGDDLTDMGISATAAAAMGREQVVLAHHPAHQLAGNTRCHDRPEAERQTLRLSLALPGGCLQVGLDGHQQQPSEIEGFGPRRFAPVGAQRWPAAGISWR